MTRDRQLDILRAIVSQYVLTREPVSSKAVAAARRLEVSSATIRNDMGLLEDEGYIFQPHTSAGRVPTEAGYRLFVDRLVDLRPLSTAQKHAIQSFLDDAVDFDDVISRAVRLLAQLTKTAAVVEYPSLGSATLRRIEVVDLAPARLMVVIVTSTGQVEERTLESVEPVSPELLQRLRERFNERCVNLSGAQIADVIDALTADFAPEDQGVAQQVADALVDLMGQGASSRIIIAGLSYLTRSGQDFQDVSNVLDALEEQVALLRLLSEVHTDPVQVSIGTENKNEILDQASVVSATYHSADALTAHLGVIGPTRMDYSRSLVAVEAVSRYLSRILLD